MRVSGNLVTNSADILRALCLGGHGIALGRASSSNAIDPSRHQLSAKVRSFIDLIAARFAEHRKWMDPYPCNRAAGGSTEAAD